ncbi:MULTISPECIES: MMPL family transporter [unclassified Paenibacillus]|uniref:MMPL family transporter n=1 Tax=unclassified Paenibacillus TaxID=185978 RepID=UPI002406FA88|nr:MULTISPECIES: MMPL family transporter [unclassified Paenibacillus]MDF9842839.1 membrane protein YdfJ [Paenibacillus sp. PastF-2]MDF9849293.1 membrane protein YdfJ [Paenibacillus sp. PastM-2]MDF9855999.1 membrane protein YdfJ [Paenibacillus sp. PastF-1]MDH6481134.1 membrane protein YdfJ [Paenibacillus sp. PastH-2]MDH6508555.1 membrane protein YdfJ [Paenibacillus sp. PastM-3]
MAKWLYRLGFWSAKNRIKVLAGSFTLLIAAAIVALSMGVHFGEETTIPGLASQQTLEVMEKEFPNPQGAAAKTQLVLRAPENKTLTSEPVQQLVNTKLKELTADAEVASVISPYDNHSLNADSTIGYATIAYKVAGDEVTADSKNMVEWAADSLRDAGLQAELIGDGYVQMATSSPTEALGVLLALVILAVALGSILTGVLPVLTAALGLGFGIMLIIIGTSLFDVPSFALSLAGMLGLAVGIDYALFIIARYRQQLGEGYERREAIAIANGTAGSAVVFAGVTVIIALVGFSFVGVPFLTAMGIAGALCVFTAILMTIFVVPAILELLGSRIKPPAKRVKAAADKQKAKRGNLWGRFVTGRPLVAVVLGVALLATVALPFFHMETGLGNDGHKSPDKTERRAYDLLSEAYGDGYHGPLVLLAETDGGAEAAGNLNKVMEEVKTYPNVVAVNPPVTGPSGTISLITVMPATGPNDSQTIDLVHLIRDKAPEIERQDQVKIGVTGSTAVNIDITQKLNQALPKFCLIIVGLAFVLLMLVFRSILVPVKAVLGFILSLGATLGFVTYVVQDGHFQKLFGFHAEAPVFNFLPIIVVGVLFGLAMDYEVFLVSRMREEFKKSGDARKSVLAGIRHSGGVVTAAGLIMVAVFTGFILAEEPMVKVMGLALAFGVLFDAFVVRMLIVPGVMTLLGKSAWYFPKWLDRLLPNLDVEGEEVMKQVEMKRLEAAGETRIRRLG